MKAKSVNVPCPECDAQSGDWCRDTRTKYRLYWDDDYGLSLSYEKLYGETRPGFTLVHPNRFDEVSS